MKQFFLLSILCGVFALGTCKKPILERAESTIPPLILSTAILDSLPFEAAMALNIDTVTGIKIKHYSGLFANYFEYNTDKELLLETLSRLPFPLHAVVADTTCYQLSTKDFGLIRKKITLFEYNAASTFWNTNVSNVDIYECLKPPYRHTVQISKTTNRILHRIEFIG